MDRLQAMQTLVRVVETGSFSAVAREQRTTQSAISKQVAALERWLGARLLARSTRALALTEVGARYFEQARRLVAEVTEAESQARAGEQQLQGLLRVAASVAFGRLRLLPLVRDFLAEHPGVQVDLRLHDGFVDLVEQGVDLAVRIGDLADSSLIARRIGTTRRALLASRDYLHRRPGLTAPRQPEDLLQHNCIVYSETVSRNVWTFTAGPGADAPTGSSRSVQINGNLQTDSSEVVRAAVLDGMGLGYAPVWLFEAELASGAVQTLMPEWGAQDMPIHLVSPPQRRHSAKVRALSDRLAAALGTG